MPKEQLQPLSQKVNALAKQIDNFLKKHQHEAGNFTGLETKKDVLLDSLRGSVSAGAIPAINEKYRNLNRLFTQVAASVEGLEMGPILQR